MANSYWLKQEKLFLNAIKDVKIPNVTLDKVDFIKVSNNTDINSIPPGGGCYCSLL